MNFLFGGYDERKMKSNMQMACHRIRIDCNKQTNVTVANKKEIAKLISSDRAELARIKCEHVIRTDEMIESLKILELFLELLVERAPAISNATPTKEEKKATGYPSPPKDLAESIASVIFCAQKLQIDELTEVSRQLGYKFGSTYVESAQRNAPRSHGADIGMVNPRLYNKVTLVPIKAKLLNAYMVEIANAYGVQYTPPDDLDELDEEAAAPAPTGDSVPVAPASNLSEAYKPTVVFQNTAFPTPSAAADSVPDVYSSMDTYDGQRNEAGQMHGHGTNEYPDGTYVGSFQNDQRHGVGKMYYKHPLNKRHYYSYQGNWFGGARQGYGEIMEISTGRVIFAGDWVAGHVREPAKQKKFQEVLAALTAAYPAAVEAAARKAAAEKHAAAAQERNFNSLEDMPAETVGLDHMGSTLFSTSVTDSTASVHGDDMSENAHDAPPAYVDVPVAVLINETDRSSADSATNNPSTSISKTITHVPMVPAVPVRPAATLPAPAAEPVVRTTAEDLHARLARLRK